MKYGLINIFSDDQLIFFLFGQEETITHDHHICQHNQSTSTHSHGSIWKGCFQVIYWLLAELLRFSCLSQKKKIPFISYVTRDENGDSHVNLLEEKENLAKLMASGTIGRMMINDKI